MAAKITVKNNANFLVEGEFELFDTDGNKFDLAGRTTIALCRCGGSKTKPFCDGTHRACNFQSVVKAHALPPIAKKA